MGSCPTTDGVRKHRVWNTVPSHFQANLVRLYSALVTRYPLLIDFRMLSGVFAAILLFQGSAASFGTRIVTRLQNVIIVMNLTWAALNKAR